MHHLFEIIAVDGTVLSVFAENFDDAAVLFSAWHVANESHPLPDFEVRQRNPSWPGLNKQHLLDALALDTPGIGRYDPAYGWAILSPVARGER